MTNHHDALTPRVHDRWYLLECQCTDRCRALALDADGMPLMFDSEDRSHYVESQYAALAAGWYVYPDGKVVTDRCEWLQRGLGGAA